WEPRSKFERAPSSSPRGASRSVRRLARSRLETRRRVNTKEKSPKAGDGNKHSRVPVLGKDANPFKKRGPDAQESTRSVAFGSSGNRPSVRTRARGDQCRARPASRGDGARARSLELAWRQAG